MKRADSKACFGGRQEVWVHDAEIVGCSMRFGVYLPPQAADGPCPVLYFLSGLTCTEQNVITKSGIQRACAEHGLILVAPDTSPRGAGVADDPTWDMGQGAGFYVNATQAPWAAHYRMHDYVVHELPALIEAHFPASDRRGVTGHSMGGHGALIAALRNPGRYKSVSAFAPIVAPSQVPWGHKAFGGYLGDDRSTWAEWDACALIPDATERLPILVDQGAADGFLAHQLKPDLLQAACQAAGHPLTLNLRPDYDHSYYFVASFVDAHVAHHAAALRGDPA
jgi:S-formylglutathione hydrolase